MEYLLHNFSLSSFRRYDDSNYGRAISRLVNWNIIMNAESSLLSGKSFGVVLMHGRCTRFGRQQRFKCDILSYYKGWIFPEFPIRLSVNDDMIGLLYFVISTIAKVYRNPYGEGCKIHFSNPFLRVFVLNPIIILRMIIA